MSAPKGKFTVAIDSDGVIADFECLVCSIFDVEKMSDIPKHKLWSGIEHYDKTVQPFFEALPKMDEADRLLDFIRENFEDIFVLTATGYTPKNADEQKRRWYARNYPWLEVVTVVKSDSKAVYASPTSILIDDRAKSIYPWVEAGGIGILHVSVEKTIEQLKELLAKP